MVFDRANTKLSDLRHRVALCTMQDVVTSGSEMELSRKTVAKCWACIDAQPHLSSFIGKAGYAVMELPTRATHKITVRAALGIEYSATAWVYEERLQSAPRWYKVLGFYEKEPHWVVLDAHLVERSDQAQPPSGAMAPCPQDIEL